MISIPIKMQLCSYLLCASGEGRANVNVEVIFDDYGFPYFPGRRLKGLLRESMIELLEIKGIPKAELLRIIQRFFGGRGLARNEGLLYIDDLHPENHAAACNYLKHSPSSMALSTANIRKYHTYQIQQTAIGEDGVAQEHSLRSYSVLNPMTTSCLVGELLCTEVLKTEELDLLRYSIQHLRRVGSRRNRGFGRVKCTTGDVKLVESLSAVPAIKVGQVLSVQIHCQQNIILSTKKGEQNTVFTEDRINGNRLRGVLAQLYIDKHGVDEDFKRIFLYGLVQFHYSYLKEAKLIPKCIVRKKYHPDFQAFNLLAKGDAPVEANKKLKGYFDKNGRRGSITTHQFHNSRPDRTAGRSLAEEGDNEQNSGSIFYYESIKKGTLLQGHISGKQELLQLILEKLGQELKGHIGKSRSAQYGRVTINLEAQTSPVEKVSRRQTYYLIAQSPILLLNQQGMPEATWLQLEAQLPGLEIKNAISTYCYIEQYNGQWRSKSGKFKAYEASSAFKLRQLPHTLKTSVGAWQEQGFGKIKFVSETELGTYLRWLNTKDSAQSGRPTPLLQNQLPKGLQKIEQYHLQQQRVLKVKTKALHFFRRFTMTLKADEKISNSLIGRMQNILKQEEKVILETLDEMKDKQAGRMLDKYLLFDALKKTKWSKDEYHSFREYQIYWSLFFNYLRLYNKKK